MNSRRFDHVDLRVRSLVEALPFYEKFLPALGFNRISGEGHWRTFSLAEPDPTEFVWIVEALSHQPNETRIAMWADSRAEVDRVAKIVADAGGRVLEGPELCEDYGPSYYAFFFEDSCGNRWEVCCRKAEG
ncbi:MAG: VOC family protein [Chthoniobacterales bacterium]|nr:VOC family protein [Chthoniobacterales bacterium]